MFSTTRILSLLALLAGAFGFVACSGGISKAPHPLQTRRVLYKASKVPRADWPTQTWTKASPASLGIDKRALQLAAEYAFVRSGNEKNRKGYRTNSLLVVYKGRLVYERYYKLYNKNKRHLTWSVSKSFVNALAGIAVRKKLMDINKPAKTYFPALNGGLKDKVTIKHLLNMSSGLKWNEGYEYSPVFSDVLMMLYTTGRKDMAAFTSGMPMKYKPGTRWLYSSGETNVLTAAIRNAVGKDKFTQFAWKELFDVIGMKSVTWESDNSGTFVGSSYLYATPRDMARFGFLYLNDGVWNGKRVLPKGWVKFTATVPESDYKGVYGAQWWVNAGRPSKGQPPRWPAAPLDTFFASGHWGQNIIVIPSYDLVIVRTADDRTRDFKKNQFLKLLLRGVPRPKATAVTPKVPARTRPAPTKAAPARVAPRTAPRPVSPAKKGGQP